MDAYKLVRPFLLWMRANTDLLEWDEKTKRGIESELTKIIQQHLEAERDKLTKVKALYEEKIEKIRRIHEIEIQLKLAEREN